MTNATLETTASSISGRVEETYTYVTNVEHQVNDITTTTQTSIGGNNLYLEDALESNAIEYHVDGKSEQETSNQSINLVDFSNIVSLTKSGITISYDKNTNIFTLDGSSTENFYLDIKKIIIEEDSTYALSLFKDSGDWGSGWIGLRTCKNGTQTQYIQISPNTYNKKDKNNVRDWTTDFDSYQFYDNKNGSHYFNNDDDLIIKGVGNTKEVKNDKKYNIRNTIYTICSKQSKSRLSK